MCIFVSDCHARVDIITCHCKTFRYEGRTLNLKQFFFQQRSSLRWRTRYRSQLLTAMLRMLQMHERRKWSKKTQTKAKVSWTVFNLFNVWLGFWAYTSKIWLFSYTSHCIAELIVQLYINPLLFRVLFRRNTTTHGSEWKPGNCPRGRDTSSRCKGQSYMKLNFEFIFLVAINLRGTFLKPFNFFRSIVVVFVLFVSVNMKSGEPVRPFVCLFGLFDCLFTLSPYPYLVNTMYLRWESQRKKKLLQFWLNNL